MKKILIVILLLGSSLTSFSQSKRIDPLKSTITWLGKKVTGQHEGILKFKEGVLIFSNSKLVGGNFIADMTSLSNTDQSGKDKIKLENHLKSSDFFDTSQFKTAKLKFKTITDNLNNSYTITADLTIKGVTKGIKFDLIVKEKSAFAQLKVDRTKYGIQYGSGSFFEDLGDRTIYDEFDLNVFLYF